MIEIECHVSTYQKTFWHSYILLANQWATFDLQIVILISISQPFVSFLILNKKQTLPLITTRSWNWSWILMWIWLDWKSKINLRSNWNMNNTFSFLVSFRSSCDQRGSHESKSKSWRYSCLYLYRNRRPDTYHYMEKGWKTYSTKVSIIQISIIWLNEGLTSIPT